MRRRLTINAAAVEKKLFESNQAGRITAIDAGEVVEFVGYNDFDRVWVKWHEAIWSISLEAWSTAQAV